MWHGCQEMVAYWYPQVYMAEDRNEQSLVIIVATSDNCITIASGYA